MAHKLNLSLVSACKAVEEANDFFLIVENCYKLFSLPAIHSQYLNICEVLEIKPLNIVSLSDTRWACRYQSIKAINENFGALVETLKSISKSSTDYKFQAIGLLSNINSNNFKLCLKIFVSILSVIHTLHSFLQSEETTLSNAISMIEATIQQFEHMRTDEFWNKFKLPDTDTDFFHPKRICKPVNFNDYVVPSTTGFRARNNEDNENFSKLHIYYPILDTLINSLKSRFNFNSLDIAKGISSLFNIDSQNISCLLEKYKFLNIDPILSESELSILKCELNHLNVLPDISVLRNVVTKCKYP